MSTTPAADPPASLVRELTLPSLEALLLFAATLLAEVPVMILRTLILALAKTLLAIIKDHSLHGTLHAIFQPHPSFAGDTKYAYWLAAWSTLALITPIGGAWWWRSNMGGRDPSEREQTAYQDALELLTTNTQHPIRLPTSWFVTDTLQPDAAVCGHTLMLSRALLESEHLPAVLAHELGHLNSSDGRLTTALNRLIIRPPARPKAEHEHPTRVLILGNDRLMTSITLLGLIAWATRKTLTFAQGGFALRLLAPAWGAYWRAREYQADQYAAHLGQADELADFLELHALIHDHPIPHIWLTNHTHPPTELRINQLRKHNS
jgi:Zn-dependent protease with chaperone function